MFLSQFDDEESEFCGRFFQIRKKNFLKKKDLAVFKKNHS